MRKSVVSPIVLDHKGFLSRKQKPQDSQYLLSRVQSSVALSMCNGNQNTVVQRESPGAQCFEEYPCTRIF